MTATQERLAKKQKVDGELTKARTRACPDALSSGGNGGCRAPWRADHEEDWSNEQAAYLMIAFRQKMMTLGPKLVTQIRRPFRCPRGQKAD